jgi:hypothetical protein
MLVIIQFFRGTEEVMNSLGDFIKEVADEINDEAGKENLTDKEESKPSAKTSQDNTDKAVIFPRKVKSKFVATKPALWEQNVQNLKNKNLKKK